MKNDSEKLPKFSYEPEADVLAWEISSRPIDYAKEIGNVVVHFSKQNTPVLVEILEATNFVTKAQKLLGKGSSKIKRVSHAFN